MTKGQSRTKYCLICISIHEQIGIKIHDNQEQNTV